MLRCGAARGRPNLDLGLRPAVGLTRRFAAGRKRCAG